MWFLIRGAFWFSLVLVMLPIFDQDATDRLANEPARSLTDVLLFRGHHADVRPAKAERYPE